MSIWQNTVSDTVDSARYFGGRAYPDPFVTYATLRMPRTIEDVLRWAETLWYRNGTYAEASRRVVRYFLTKIDISDASEDEKKKYEKFLNETLNLLPKLALMGDDFFAYGNAFTSLFVPFRRYLRCNGCGVEKPLRHIDYEFKNFKFEFTCDHCNTRCVSTKPIDRRTQEEQNVQLIRWSVHQIKIKHHHLSNQSVYLWDPPATFKRQLTSGDKLAAEFTPWEIIDAVKQNKLFEFAPGVMFHLKEEGLAGIHTNGWGITRFMTNFTQAYHVQMLKLYNEVLAQEYIVPFRVITPAPQSPGGDPAIVSNLGSFGARVNGMLRDFRRRPGGWHWMPQPIQYQALGGEGMQMATYELINQAMDEMLNAAGVPAELYKGTLNMQAMPTALRLFQQSWGHYVSGLNNFLRWLMEKISTIFNWEAASAKMQPVMLADNVENKQMFLSLAAANQLSKATAFAPLGIDSSEEQAKILDEQRRWQDLQDKFNKEQQSKQMLEQQMQSTVMQNAGIQGGQGMGADPNSGAQITPGDIMAKADQMAQQLLQMPDGDRKSEMIKIKKSDPTLHALVKVKVEEQRGQAQRVGGQQVLQQQAQQGAPQQA